MIYLDLIINLALLVALSIVSGFIEKRWPRSTRLGVLLQGALFGGASVIGMLRPLNMGSGLIFDGRSVMISLCALFFGPWAAAVTILMTIPCRIALGGSGMIMGVLVILSSAGIGLAAHFRQLQATEPPSTRNLYLFGLVVHLVMVALMITLPGNIIMSTIKRIGIPVILLYPLATILAGKILSDQVSAIRNIEILKKSEEKFKNFFESANVGKSITLPSGEINVNQAYCDMLGYTREELINKKWQDITPVDDIETTQNLLDLLLQGREDSVRFNKRYIHKNGSYIWADISVAIQRDIDRQPLFFITTVIDITERKKMEETLQENERKLREVQEMAHLGSWHWDMKTGDVEWSEEVYKIFHLDPKEFTPHIDSVLALSPWPEDHQRDKELIKRAIEKHGPGFYEQKFLRPDKTIGYYYSTFQGNYDVKGELNSIIGTVMDITENKLAESRREAALEEINRLNTKLEQKVDERTSDLHNSQLALLNMVDDLNQSVKNTDLINRKLEETNKEIAAFSYSVSHDLRAPLRSIDGFSLALLEDYQGKLDDTGRNYLNKIRAAAQHMGLLIENMLKLSRITHAEFHHESIDLSKIVQSIAETLQQSNPDKDMKITIQEGIVINGDLNSMQIAMTNLLENAWKFTGKQKHPSVEFGMTLTADKKVFFIRDNGAGFDMAYAGKLFGAFQRLHGIDEFPGTGIGLATVKRIITRHGGQIWAESEVGKGATFFFTLPE